MELTILDINQINNELFYYVIDYKNSGFNKASTNFADFTALFPKELNNDMYIELKSMGCNRPEIYSPESPFWTKSNYNNCVSFVNLKRSEDFNNYINLKSIVFSHTIGIRPVIKYSNISKKIKNKKKNPFEIYEIEYGEYPNKYVSNDLKIELDKLYNTYSLKTTGKTYTTYKLDEHKRIYEKKYIEYIYNNKKYVKCDDKWLEVSPIEWIIDEKNDIVITKYSIVSGIPFDTKENYDGNFKNTFMYNYLNNVLAKEIKPSKYIMEDIDIVKLDEIKKKYISTKENYICNKTSSNYKKYIKVKNEYYDILIKSAEQLRNDSNNKSLTKDL